MTTFYEQLGGLAEVFDKWGPCEQTVVICALARRVPWPGLKLVHRVVEAALRQHLVDDKLERDANDERILSNLIAMARDYESDEGMEYLTRLLTLLPHLQVDNEHAKNVFVSSVPALVQRCMDSPRQSSKSTNLCRQFLSYMLVHPALTNGDHSALTMWLRYLENYISGNRNTETVWKQRIDPSLLSDNTNIWSSTGTFRRTIGKNIEFKGRAADHVEHCTFIDDLLRESFSKNGVEVDICVNEDKINFDAVIAVPKSKRSNSLTPPSTASNSGQSSSSAENLNEEQFVQKPRSFSLSNEYSLAQMKPIRVMYGTTSSETRLDDLKSNNFVEHPGMSTVGQWLKNLRLHKYIWLFSNISFEQMCEMDEEYLEKLGVTKGARHKIILSIQKLSERESVIEGILAELSAPGKLTPAVATRALDKLKSVLMSPMPPVSSLPASIVTVLELASHCMYNGGNGRDPYEVDVNQNVDPMSLHCWLVEKALHHECFQQPALVDALKRLRHRLPPRQFFNLVNELPSNKRLAKQRWRNNTHTNLNRTLHRDWSSHQYRYELFSGPSQPRGKSNSYPPFRMPVTTAPHNIPQHVTSLPEDYSSLDALCLQMTEQAIN